ncbi:hypothetical protein AVEN_186580-1 [Araneus ventricosus]|uniref:Uncharacterized protein n=1 Tax=Araneus ventricosus TaxID=182803 RepID=A0A4Y2NR75_ARAVE|nr:hypothetical protein AVEN_186580-1 [Araneus ventricosus]
MAVGWIVGSREAFREGRLSLVGDYAFCARGSKSIGANCEKLNIDEEKANLGILHHDCDGISNDGFLNIVSTAAEVSEVVNLQ